MRLQLFVPTLKAASASWKVNHVRVLIYVQENPRQTRTAIKQALNTSEMVVDDLTREGFLVSCEGETFPVYELTEASKHILPVALGKETALIQSLKPTMPLSIFRCLANWTVFESNDPAAMEEETGIKRRTLQRYFRIFADRGLLLSGSLPGQWKYTKRGREVFEVPSSKLAMKRAA